MSLGVSSWKAHLMLADVARRTGGVVAWVLSKMETLPKHFTAILGEALLEVQTVRTIPCGTLNGCPSVPIVQRSGRGPFKAETRVRFPVGTPPLANSDSRHK